MVNLKKTIITIILSVIIIFNVNAQFQKSIYIGINIYPIIENSFEIGSEINNNQNLSFHCYIGNVFKSKKNSPLKIVSPYTFKEKSGYFIKTGVKYNIRKNISKFALFISVNLINSYAIEKATYVPLYISHSPIEKLVSKNSYNLGFSGEIGITTPANKIISIDLALQGGSLLVNNLLDFNSYMPGMGIKQNESIRFQGILRIKILINKKD